MQRPRIAVVGVGSFGKNHVRVIHESPHAQLAGVLDLNPELAADFASRYGCQAFSSLEDLARHADAAVVATPTVRHAEVGCRLLMELGLDVLVEKPIASSIAEGKQLVDTAALLEEEC